MKMEEKPKGTHAIMNQIPAERIGNMYEMRQVQWGMMSVSFEKAMADMDVTPYLKGLPNDRDPCPHWGYVFKGKIIVRYADHEETVNTGEAYYMAPGHTAIVTEGTELLEFSPMSELQKTMEVITKNMKTMQMGNKK